MPLNPKNCRMGEQWDECAICGILFPMSHLIRQKGRLVCVERCVDNLEPERHALYVSKVLSEGAEDEGVDMRYVDHAFFASYDEEVY